MRSSSLIARFWTSVFSLENLITSSPEENALYPVHRTKNLINSRSTWVRFLNQNHSQHIYALLMRAGFSWCHQLLPCNLTQNLDSEQNFGIVHRRAETFIEWLYLGCYDSTGSYACESFSKIYRSKSQYYMRFIISLSNTLIKYNPIEILDHKSIDISYKYYRD